MKWLLILLFPFTLFAEAVEWGDQEPLPEPPPFYPFSFGGSYLNAAKADIRTAGFEGTKLKYEQYDANFNYTMPFSPVCGMIFGAGWVGTEVNWPENPDFNETDFNYAILSLGGFSKAFTRWTWTLNGSIWLDTAEFSFVDYALYQALLWGKYELCSFLELDFGFLLEAGLNKDKIWPIFGFIYRPSDNLRIHAVYPIDMVIEYDFREKWMMAGAIRILRNRHRVKNDEPLPRSIFQYQTWGGEYDLQYKPFKRFLIRGFAGSTFGGDLRIARSDDKHGTHYKFRPSFYGGFNSVLSF
ncbi:MAG: hypothetical protein S4CHLAM45_14420 [Chlamydiales bacterium]|nr:hypothetical protein [Chlamydiales bacterium]MCH9620049.1 hypothetical protein [Chlamydiales bacterium]MCH9623532.1 hypothetical protein [Chlamydiales bacterium]